MKNENKSIDEFEVALARKCNKVDIGMECLHCWYPYCEAAFSDAEPPFLCDIPTEVLLHFADTGEDLRQ